MWSTYAVGSPKSMATCFVVSRKNAQGKTVPVVVTSRHALRHIGRGPTYLAVRILKPNQRPVALVISFKANSPAVPFQVEHPRYDVAAFPLIIPDRLTQKVLLPTYLSLESLERAPARPRVGQEVSFLGFPDVYPGTTGAFPVLRGGKIASYDLGPDADPHRFLINSQVYPGDSGGPVFIHSRRGRPQILGMITERVGRMDSNRTIPIGVAVDASAIRETLLLLDKH